jgi:ubiquinone/menaquinone biosynthesis C-methylase UbiE
MVPMYQTAVAQWGKNFAQKFDLRPYKNILDVGCRKGLISHSLAEQYPDQQFFAIDNVSSEIEYAKQYGAHNIEFAKLDALTLPFESEFDAVMSFNCLFWIQNKQQALKKIYQSLKPGGKAFLQFFVSQQTTQRLSKQAQFYQEVSKAYLDFYQYTDHEPFAYQEYLLEVICEKPLQEKEAPLHEGFQYGSIGFSVREAQILKHFLQGKSAKEVGTCLHISAKTVEFHLQSIRNRLGCNKRSELYQAALSHGFIHLMFDTLL